MERRFDRKSFENFILNKGMLGISEKPFTLVSGRESHFYVNWRLNDVFLLDQVSDYVLDFVRDLGIEADCFYGVPEGQTRLANLTQVKFAKQSPNYGEGSHVLPMGRGKPKDHGDPKDKYFVGAPEGRVIILEDLTTTTGSLIYKGIKPLQEKELNSDIVAAIVLTDRGVQKGYAEEKVKSETGVDYYSMSHAFNILPEACRRSQPSDLVKQALKREFKNYGEPFILD